MGALRAPSGSDTSSSLRASELRIAIPIDADPISHLFVESIVASARAIGSTAEAVELKLPVAGPIAANVLALQPPLSFLWALTEADPDLLRQSVVLCLEPPSSAAFEHTADLAARAAHAMHTHRAGCTELARRGIDAVHFQVGWSAALEAVADPPKARAIDILHIGACSSRNEKVIASWAADLWPHRSRIVTPEDVHRASEQYDHLLGGSLRSLLRNSEILLMLHDEGRRHLQWPLAVAAIANGCVVIAEHALDSAPLQAGEHHLTGRAEDLALIAGELIADERSLLEMRSRAYAHLRNEIEMASSVARLLTLVRTLPPPAQASSTRAASAEAFRAGAHVRPEPIAETADQAAARAGGPRGQSSNPECVAHGMEPLCSDPESKHSEMSHPEASLKRLLIQTTAIRRRLDAIEHWMRFGTPPQEPVEVCWSASFATASPTVSVIVPVWNYERELESCLHSIAASEGVSFEVLALDDASDDGSAAFAQRFIEAHPWLPAKLWRSPINLGVAHARNELISHARGAFLFVMDADNIVFPTALRRLLDTLEADPSAAFSYPMQAVLREGEMWAVHNVWPWDEKRLMDKNYIDAMALIRRAAILDVGGYSEDPRLDCCEDHDLWARFAERRWYGSHVAEMLAIYRIQAHSKSRTVRGAENQETISLIRSHAPTLMARLARPQVADAGSPQR